jgi:hypothetical protein
MEKPKTRKTWIKKKEEFLYSSFLLLLEVIILYEIVVDSFKKVFVPL